MNKNHEMYVISHSHWDREWRYSFAETRLKLVEMMDCLLELLDTNPDYKHYHLDGQTILLEDYLEIRPEMKDKLKKYIMENRILVGPWYTLPDEFLVRGESLVRNLLLGHKVALKFGKVMKVGYTPTSCGQISQLPQIYAGFGIDSILFYRGLNPDDARAEFIWEGADDTRALAFHFYTWGRANFSSLILVPVLFDGWTANTLNDVKGHFHLQDQPYPYVNDLNKPPVIFHRNQLGPKLKQVKEDALKYATTRHLLYMDGCDNGAPHSLTTRIIEEANKLAGDDKYIHSTLPEYVEKVKKTVSGLEVLKGEMRRQGKERANAVYSGVLSARMYLKQMNARAENNLAGRAEPWAVIAWLFGEKYPAGILERAWKYLLANHTHDSMEGVSIDRVHADMEYRFCQCDEMSLGILRRSLNKIAHSFPINKKPEIGLTVFNSLPTQRSGLVSTVLSFPENKKVKSFSIYDSDQELFFEIAAHEKKSLLVEQLEINTSVFPADRFTINFFARDIPALGYKVFRVIPHQKSNLSESSGLNIEPHILENEYLRVKINTNGSLNIKEKQTGRSYSNMHFFEDGGEAGDSLWHQPPEKDSIITSLKNKSLISLEHTGPFSITYKVEVKMKLPSAIVAAGKKRGSASEIITVSSWITLARGAKRLDIVTRLKNSIKDHRLRVLFPSGINAEFSWAGGQFDVLKRPVKSVYKDGYAEPKVVTHPQYSFVDISDGKSGIAILSKGLTEYEVIDNSKRTIALTLIRSFEKICGTPSRENTGGQCLREFEFRYSIYPHTGDYQEGNVFQEARDYNIPFEITQSARYDNDKKNSRSFFAIEPSSLILSALKKSENRGTVILRFFNPTLSTIKGRVYCLWPIKKSWETNLSEERQRELELKDKHSFIITAGAKKIITLEIMLKEKV